MGTIDLVPAADSAGMSSNGFIPQSLRRFAGSLSVTLAGQALLLCGLFLVTRISVHAFGAEGFGQYQVARRTLAVVAFPLMCGLGISLPRYIARDIAEIGEVTKWMVSSIALATMVVFGFLLLGIAGFEQIGQWTFGTGSEHRLVLSLLIAATGMFCATLATAAMRGLSRFHLAALLQVVNGAFVPLIAVLLAAGRVERALLISGGLWIVIAAIVFFCLSREWESSALTAHSVWGAVKELFIFGLPRVPGDIALFGLFALPAYAAVHRNDILGAGFLSVGLSLVQAIATAFASAGFVLLPYWSRAARSSNSLAIARKRTVKLIIVSCLVSTMLLGLLEIFLLPVVRLLLGPLAMAGIHSIRYVMLAAVPYVLYLVLRDYFDALTVFPLNTIALGVAILAQFALINVRQLSVPVATAISFLVLGLTMLVLWVIPMRHLDTASD